MLTVRSEHRIHGSRSRKPQFSPGVERCPINCVAPNVLVGPQLMTEHKQGTYRWTSVRRRVSVGFIVVFSEESMTVVFMIDKQTREETVNGK